MSLLGKGKSIIDDYYDSKIKEIELKVKSKQINFMRLQAQRNDLNEKLIKLKDELKYLLKSGSQVGEVIKILGKDKVLVKAANDGKYIVQVDKKVNIEDLRPSLRVTLGSAMKIERILPNRVDPLVSLMRVEKVPDATYDMVGGLDKQIKEIREVIELPIKHPEVFESLGISQPKGVLMYGPPGTGKTLLAKACAHNDTKGDSEVQRTMLELLNQLDGFEETQNIKMIMATNRIDILDDALLRPGRIDRKIEFPNPNEKARYDILKIHSRKMNLVRGVDLHKIAGMLNEASGADCKACCSEAGMFALRERRIHVTQEDFEMAVAKVMKKDDDKSQLKKIWK